MSACVPAYVYVSVCVFFSLAVHSNGVLVASGQFSSKLRPEHVVSSLEGRQLMVAVTPDHVLTLSSWW